MKLSLESYGTKHTIEIDRDDIDMDELFQLLKQLCLCVGYHPENVEECFGNQ